MYPCGWSPNNGAPSVYGHLDGPRVLCVQWVGARNFPRNAHTLIGPSGRSGDQPMFLQLVRLLLNDTSPYAWAVPRLSLCLTLPDPFYFLSLPPNRAPTPPLAGTSDRKLSRTHRYSRYVERYPRSLVTSCQQRKPNSCFPTLDDGQEKGVEIKKYGICTTNRKNTYRYISDQFGKFRGRGKLLHSSPPFLNTSRAPQTNKGVRYSEKLYFLFNARIIHLQRRLSYSDTRLTSSPCYSSGLLVVVCILCRLHVTDDPRLTMKWSSAPLVLMTLLMALVTLAEEVASKNKAGRGRGSKWW